MKETVLVILGLLFIFFPWMIGIVDVLSWALLGSQLTNIPWEAGRGALLVLWPFFWLTLLGMFGHAFTL